MAFRSVILNYPHEVIKLLLFSSINYKKREILSQIFVQDFNKYEITSTYNIFHFYVLSPKTHYFIRFRRVNPQIYFPERPNDWDDIYTVLDHLFLQ